MIEVNEARALEHLLDLLKIPGLSGQEGKIAAEVKKKLRAAGCKSSWIQEDHVHQKLGRGFETGNLIVRVPGSLKTGMRLFSGHMDTVPLCRGAEPVRRSGRIVARGKTALGADNRTAVACLLVLIETILMARIPHPPILLLFTIAEEIGLLGSKHVRISDLGHPDMGFNIDSGSPEKLITGAIGASRWTADVIGRSAHAGVHPEEGISAILIASRAIEEVADRGYFGKVVKGRKRGTSNVGSICGGEATNQVTDRVRLTGECRSHDSAFVNTIVAAYQLAFTRASESIRNSAGKTGQVRFKAVHDYDAFALKKSDPVVRFALQTAKSIGIRATTDTVDGGLDANSLNRKGIPTVTLGAGQHNPHTVDEYVDIREYFDGCRLALALATA